MARELARVALVVGPLAALGPFAIDMYLPALPLVASDLGASVQATQATLTGYFVAFGLCQLVYGPLSDRWGRKPPLYVGIAIFLAGTVAAILAQSIAGLVAARFVQGLGAAAVMVIPRAIVRDLHTGPEATRLMALVMLVISVAPMTAPLIGSLVMPVGGWRAIFGLLAVLAVACLALTAFVLEETLPPAARVAAGPASLWRGVRRLLGDGRFMGLTLVAGFSISSFFIFVASAAFVYTRQYGLSPTGFSLAFAVNAIGFFAASQFAASLGERYGMTWVILLAVAGFAALSALLFALVLAGFGALWLLIALLFAANACLGLVMPTTMVMALDPHPDIAGLASSLGGTLQMTTGAVMIAVAGPFFDGTAAPMVGAIALAGLLALVAAALTLRRDA
jgi:DHA1 family bicyclomycin/chloramphenicol resistance-like MFS transporter